jgi:carboxymethylenebutenolidase
MSRSYFFRVGRWSGLAASIVMVTSFAQAQVPKAMPPAERLEQSPRHHEWMDVFAQSGRKIRSYVVYPEVDKPVMSVVVIHENRGLDAWARSLADQLAEAGYVAIAPDLLTGKGPEGGGTDSFKDTDSARAAIYALGDEEVRESLDIIVKTVRDLPATTDRVVVVGFCWGGGKAFDYAAHGADLSGVCVFYGAAPKQEVLEQIKVPVYGFYGGNDFRITGEVPKLRDAMKQLGKQYEPVIYEGAGHGFLRAGDEPGAKEADRRARDAAWERLLTLLKQLSG